MVIGLVEDIAGNIWAECRGEAPKLVRIREFRVIEEISPPRVPPAWQLAPDPHGGIWIATKKGDLILFRQGAQQKFPLNSTAKNPSPHKIMAQEDGSVVGAFDDGLVEFRQGKVQQMTTKNGLPCNEVISFTKDNARHWWLYTRCGVVEVSDSELERWWTNPATVVESHTYDRFDGAQPNVAAFNSAARSIDGRVWFASGVVVQVMDPSTLPQKALPAETYIESVIVDRRQFPATANLTIAPHPRDLQVDYTSPTFTIPQRVRFRYRLDGYDHDWHEAGTRREAFYTDLRPGKYSFRVIACNNDGEWDASPAKLDFSIAPAYYQTKWFRALCAGAFLALLWAAYHYRVRRLRHEFEMTLDARVGERTRIARELHDTLLQTFHGLMLRFGAVDRLLPNRAEEAKKELRGAMAQAGEAITEGRDAVQALRSSTVEVNDLVSAIRTIGEELAANETNQGSTSFEVRVEGTPRDLRPLLRDEVYRIATEALRNAFLHAHARQVEAEIRYDKEQFRLRVRDDGRGIDPAILSHHGRDRHYGLPGMRERAQVVGGKLVVWSELNSGTELELTIPAANAYAAAPRRSWWSQRFSGKHIDAQETKIES
jgi:signal transduction histidine kinase